ncbi:MAG: gliding motility protein GldL [Chitinophagales bacterium]|nr:gliding motility protein GldL [Chitinophagales bacterium]
MAFYESRGFLYFKNLLIGLGAAFIILGALGKIMHYEWGNTVLPMAMMFEAGIFAIQAIIPPHKEYHWEKLYPGLHDVYAKVSPLQALDSGLGKGTTQQLDEALSKANVTQDLIKRLGTHLGSLTDNLAKLGDATSLTGATSEYTKNAQAAATALSKVKTAYESAAAVASDLATASADTKKYHEQVQLVSKNLAALNAVYELELQDTNNHLKAMNKFYTNLTDAIKNLNESVEDTQKYKQQMAALAGNLSSLNNVYGNMLSAMAMGAKTAPTK